MRTSHIITESIKGFALAILITAVALLMGTLLATWVCNPDLAGMCRYY